MRTFIYLLTMILPFSCVFSQTCDNIPAWPSSGPIGIQTTSPLKPLHIQGWTGVAAPYCQDPAIRLSYIAQSANYVGHLVLITPGNVGSPPTGYSSKANIGDLILQAGYDPDPIDGFTSNDIVLTTQTPGKKIRMTLMEDRSGWPGSPPNEEVERFTIKHNGNTGFSQADPKELIHFGVNGTIRDGSTDTHFARNIYYGTGGVSYLKAAPAWMIQFNDNTNYMKLVSMGTGA